VSTDDKPCKLSFGCKAGDQGKVWAPEIFCSSYSRTLGGWLKGKHKSMPFAVEMVWRELQDHLHDCYFCMIKINGFSRFSKHKIEYLNITSHLRSVHHDNSMAGPKPPQPFTLDSGPDSEGNKIGHSIRKQHQVRRMRHIGYILLDS
jgi:hypothetical protein